MSDSLYRKELLRWAADAHGAGRLSGDRTTGCAHNPVCGDKITVDLALAKGRIAAIAQDTRACVLTQASASILGDRLRNSTRADVEALRTRVAAMLNADAEPPAPPFEAFGLFDGTTAFRGRHRCVLLPFDAVLAAFDASETCVPARIRPEE